LIPRHVHVETRILSHELGKLLCISLTDFSQHDCNLRIKKEEMIATRPCRPKSLEFFMQQNGDLTAIGRPQPVVQTMAWAGEVATRWSLFLLLSFFFEICFKKRENGLDQSRTHLGQKWRALARVGQWGHSDLLGAMVWPRSSRHFVGLKILDF